MMEKKYKKNEKKAGLVYALLLFYVIRTTFTFLELGRWNYSVVVISLSLFVFLSSIVLSGRTSVHIAAALAAIAAVAVFQNQALLPGNQLPRGAFDRYYDVLVPAVPMFVVGVLSAVEDDSKGKESIAFTALLFDIASAAAIIPLCRRHRIDEGDVYFGRIYYAYYIAATVFVAAAYIAAVVWMLRRKKNNHTKNGKKNKSRFELTAFDVLVCCVFVASGIAAAFSACYYIVADARHELIGAGYILLDSHLVALGLFLYNRFLSCKEKSTAA